MVAMFRAIESERPDALFRDPLAAKVAGARGREIVERLSAPRLIGVWSVAIRTVIIDAYITRAIEQGADTILNLGAGLDTRPYRLDLPSSLRWREVDLEPIITLKEERLHGEQPRCRLERTKLDLSDPDARRRFLEDVAADSRNVLVVTEGVVPYLPNDAVAALARELRSLHAMRGWVVDYLSPDILRLRESVAGKEMQNAPFRFRPEDWFGFFEAHGWSCTERHFVPEEGERLGRPGPIGPQAVGYCLLTPITENPR